VMVRAACGCGSSSTVDEPALVSHDRSVRKARVWVLVGVVGVMVTGCSDATPATQVKTSRTAQLGGPIGPVPGAMPVRLCTSNIFTGDDSAAVVHTPDDIVVGPLRFSTLRQASQLHQYSFHTPHGVAFGIKVPLTIAGTRSRWVAVRVAGDQGRVKIVYDPTSFVGGAPGDPKRGSDRAALQSAIACGSGSPSFVQYNGGFTWIRGSCATIQAFAQTGRLLGTKRVAFGVRRCS
jgi:hypothetical protein